MLFIGRVQEKTALFRTERRRDANGDSYPWIVKTTGVVNHFYVYAVDAEFGPFFPKFRSYFPYNLHRRTPPDLTRDGHRIAGLRLGDRRAHALLQALLVFGLSGSSDLAPAQVCIAVWAKICAYLAMPRWPTPTGADASAVS